MANFDISNMTDDEIMNSSEFLVMIKDTGVDPSTVDIKWKKTFLATVKPALKLKAEADKKALERARLEAKSMRRAAQRSINKSKELSLKDKLEYANLFKLAIVKEADIRAKKRAQQRAEELRQIRKKNIDSYKERKRALSFFDSLKKSQHFKEDPLLDSIDLNTGTEYYFDNDILDGEKIKAYNEKQSAYKKYSLFKDKNGFYKKRKLIDRLYDKENGLLPSLGGKLKGVGGVIGGNLGGTLVGIGKVIASPLVAVATAAVAVVKGFKKMYQNMDKFEKTVLDTTKSLSSLSQLTDTELSSAMRGANEEANKLQNEFLKQKVSSYLTGWIKDLGQSFADLGASISDYAWFVEENLKRTGAEQLTQQGTAPHKIVDQTVFALDKALDVMQQKYTELTIKDILSLPEYQDWFNYFLNPTDKGMGGYTTSGWEGYMYSLGRYIPGANYSQGDIRKMQQEYIAAVGNNPDLIAQYTEQTRLLKTIGQNLYDFDEVISNSNVFIPDSDIAANLTGDDLSSMMAEEVQPAVDATRDGASAIEAKLGDLLDNSQKLGVDINDWLDYINDTELGAYGTLQNIEQFIKDNADYSRLGVSSDYHVEAGNHIQRLKDAGWNISDEDFNNRIGMDAHGYYHVEGTDPSGVRHLLYMTPSGNIEHDRNLNTGEQYYANGGIGTVESHNNTLFEGNRPEAIIPLTSSRGIDFMANAIRKANESAGNIGGISVNLELSGINIADNDRQWNEVAQKLGERIALLNRKAGNYFG